MLTPAERLILLNQYRILELIDPTNAQEHDRDAQAIELGQPNEIRRLFELIDLEPLAPPTRHRPNLYIVSDE